MRYVLIADDHEVTRRGVREILCDAFENLEISEASDVPALFQRLGEQTRDLILLDVLMPGGHVLDVLQRIRAVDDSVPVLILTAVMENEYVIQTLRAGASGLIHKHHAADELLKAIHMVLQGGHYVDSDSATVLAASLVPKDAPSHERLSVRELEIFRRIARGQAIKEIAADLELSDKTVATYLARIRGKTGLSSHVDIARYALMHKLVD